jgi:hypothetical protein
MSSGEARATTRQNVCTGKYEHEPFFQCPLQVLHLQLATSSANVPKSTVAVQDSI